MSTRGSWKDFSDNIDGYPLKRRVDDRHRSKWDFHNMALTDSMLSDITGVAE